MRKLLISLGLLFLAATVGASNSVAQSITALSTANTGIVTFTTGMVTNTGMNVTATTGFAGFPKGPLLSTATSWSLDAGPLTLTPIAPANTSLGVTGTYTVSGTLNFTLKDASNMTVLTGTLTFPNAQLSLTNTGDTLTLNGNLTIASGSVCTAAPSACMSGAQNHVTLVVDLAMDHMAGTFGVGQATIGNVAGIVTTPEPTSMLLFGTGLLAFGGILRRKLLA